MRSLDLAGHSKTGVVGPKVEIDVVAEITALLIQEIQREVSVAERLTLFWARAESVRDAAPHEKIKKAFVDLAERSRLVRLLRTCRGASRSRLGVAWQHSICPENPILKIADNDNQNFPRA